MSGSPSGMNQDTDVRTLVARISRVEDVVPLVQRGGGFASQGRNQYLPIASTGTQVGKIDLTSTNVLSFQGIVAPNVIDGQFTVSKPSDSSATIYWDGTNSSRVIVIRRADGTSSTVPPSNITITGLTHDVQYEALPYWSPNNACGLGFAPGTVGTPQIAFASTTADTTVAQAVAIQSLAGNEPLGTISWTQPASGGSGGASDPVTPPTRQPGTCVRLGTHIEPLGSPRPSEIRELIHPQEKWVHLEAGSFVLECTPNHSLYHAERGKIPASEFNNGDYIITRFGEMQVKNMDSFMRACQKVEVQMKFGHLYWANGFLSHNSKIQLPQ